MSTESYLPSPRPSYTYRGPANENRTLDNGIIVRRYRILSTNFVAYDAWELTGNAHRDHSTITFIDGTCYGQINSRRDDSTYAHLPVGDERSAAVRAHYAAMNAECYAAILAAFPEAVKGKQSGGQIEVSYA